MQRLDYKSIASTLAALALLCSCDAIIDIKTNAADLDCATLMEDAYCIKVRNGQIESVKDLEIEQGKILSDNNAFALSWRMPKTAKGILGTKIVLASDKECTKEVNSVETPLENEVHNFIDIKDGIYYGCVFAKGRAAGLIAAKNNGIRIVVEATPPQITALSESLYSSGFALDKILEVKAVSGISYNWAKASGPGELSFSDANAANTSFKASVDGKYIINFSATNEVGKKSTKTLTITIDTTNPGDPTAVTVPVATNTDFKIDFKAGTELNPAAFNIKACTTGCTLGCVGETTATTSPGTIASTALKNGLSYQGCVQGKDLAGNTTQWIASKGVTIFDTTTPIAPSGLSVAAYSASVAVPVTFTMGTDANMSTHSFKACTSNNCNAGCLAPVLAPTSPAQLTGLVNGSAHFICGQAVDLAGNVSTFSFTPATVIIDRTAPANPTNVSVPAGTMTGFDVTFTGGAETNPSTFNVKACTNSGCSAGCVGATTTTASPVAIAASALTLGTAYFGCVQGTDLAGNTSVFVASASTVLLNTFAITYSGNGSTGGSVPTDAASYAIGNTVTVLGNTGSLVKSGYTFGGWNTANNGTGSAYSAGQSFSLSGGNTTLYAQWTVSCSSLAGGTYVMVPGDSIYGTSSFCVQKYAAANVASVPTAQSGSAPWVSINQTDSIAKCAALGAGYHLITNPEWMTVAANLANVSSNWSGSAVGSGTLRRGHSDTNPNSACAADASDANAYVETNCTGTSSGTFTQRRTSTLSNGAVVWDIGGNVYNWVNYNNSVDKPTPATGVFYEYTAITGSTTTPKSHLVPLNSAQSWWTDSWNSAQGIGKIYPGANGSGGALGRGGNWGNDVDAGPFFVALADVATFASSYIGLRCAYTPATFAVTYDANTATGGSPPNDPTLYASGNTVTVKNNPMTLVKTSNTFAGWNTLANGTGTSYTPGGTFTISANTTLYANWINCTGLAGGTYVAVPGDAVYGTKGFCVQKYLSTDVGGVPTSQAGVGPWISSSWNNSRTVCSNLGANYHLIRNPEWMTIAANFANVGSNWSGGTVGSGALRKGHADMDPFAHCAANADDAYGWVQGTCTGTNSGTFAERRTSTLSNGVVVWDIGGNVWNFVDYSNNADKPTPATAAWYEFNDVTGSTTTPRSHIVPINSVQSWWNDSWTSTQGIGLIYPGVNGGGGGGSMERGGYYTGGAGAFSMRLSLFGGSGSSQTAMRCVYQP